MVCALTSHHRASSELDKTTYVETWSIIEDVLLEAEYRIIEN